MGGVSNLIGREVVNRRRTQLGLPPIQDLYAHLQAQPVLFAVDPVIAKPPGDWPSATHQTGSWMLEQTDHLPAEVERFLEGGPPPIYIGFGSMPSRDPAARTRVIVEAVAASHQRAMLSSGWAQLGQSELPATCKVVGALNHQRLFPRLAAIVHHGGAGTTSSAVRAGVPQVIVPHMFDRPYWAARVQALGVAPPPVAKSFTARSLAAAIHHATSTPALTERARLLRDQVAGVNGVTEAVRFLSSQASRLS